MFTCKGCPTRTPGCHDKCEKYQKEKAEYEALKEKQRFQNDIERGLASYQCDGYYRRAKRMRSRFGGQDGQ